MNENKTGAAKKPAHTPGPYPLLVTVMPSGLRIISTNQGNHFAETWDPTAARLIAAAPDLLAALVMLTNDAWNEDRDTRLNSEKIARAAILRAEAK